MRKARCPANKVLIIIEKEKDGPIPQIKRIYTGKYKSEFKHVNVNCNFFIVMTYSVISCLESKCFIIFLV